MHILLICLSTDHNIRTKKRIDRVEFKGKCYKCGEEGHKYFECPKIVVVVNEKCVAKPKQGESLMAQRVLFGVIAQYFIGLKNAKSLCIMPPLYPRKPLFYQALYILRVSLFYPGLGFVFKFSNVQRS